MPITPSDIIGIETLATSDQLWALGFLLAANWGEDVTVSTAFQTDVTTHHDDSEQRFGLINRGTRTVDVQQVTFDQDELLELQVILQRASIARSLFPLVSDFTVLDTAAVISATVLACDTTDKRFFVGGRVAIIAPDYSVFTVGEIAAITSGSITLDAGLDLNYAAGSEIVPLIEAKINLSQTLVIITDRTVICRVTAQELPGPQSLEAKQAPGTTPAAYDEYLGYPIFNLRLNLRDEAKIDMVRAGAFSGSGVSQVATTYGDRMRTNRSGTLTFEDRTEAFDFIKLFESRAGCLFPFWVASSTSDYQFVSFGANQIVVKAVGAEIDWDYRPWIAVVANDGTVEVRTISSQSRGGGNDTLTLDSSFTIASGDIDRVCIAQLSRFKNDALKEQWKNDGVMECLFEAVEVPGELDVEITNLDDPTTDPICERFDILACQTAIEAGEGDTGGTGTYSCDDCIMTDCQGDPLNYCEGLECCTAFLVYGGELRAYTFFDGTELAAGVPGAMDLGAWCGCRNTFTSTGTPCVTDLGTGMIVHYWLCFAEGEIEDENTTTCCCPNNGATGCLLDGG